MSQQTMLYRAKTRMLFDLSKKGIANVASDLRGGKAIDLLSSITSDALKEQIAKNVGPLDVAFDALRLGVLNTVDAQDKAAVSLAKDAMNLFGVIQEVGNIKGKKLPTAAPIAETLAGTINALIDSKGANQEAFDLFQSVVKDIMFRRVNLDQEFGEVVGSTGGLNKTINEALQGKKIIEMDKIFGMMRSLFAHINEAGYREQKTNRRIAAASLQETRAQTIAMQGMLEESVQAKLTGIDKVYGMSDLETVHGKIFNYLNKNINQAVGSSRMGTIAAGLAGSLVLGASMGYGGYSPEPLLMEGEVVSPELKDAIRAGSALDAGQSQDEFMRMQNSVNNDIINRNMHLGETLMHKGSSMQFRGEAGSMQAVRDLTMMMNSVGSNGHFTMNDTRSPKVTENYVRRKFMGE